MIAQKSFLASIEPFRLLPPAELDRVVSLVSEARHGKGETVFSEGEEAESVWILKSGRMDIYKYSADGKPTAIESIAPGQLFGTLCRVGGQPAVYPCTAIAAVDSVALRIADRSFWELFRQYPAIVAGIRAMCSERLNGMQETTGMAQDPVETRIVKVLLQLARTHGDTLPFTRREISQFASTTVETTIRTLSKFQKSKIISSTRGKITLRDPGALEALVR